MNHLPYSAELLDHFYHPRHVGVFDADHADVWSAQVGVPGRTNVVRLSVQINAERCIEKICFQAYGCCAAIASMSWLCDQFAGAPLSALAKVTADDVINALDLPQKKWHCALLLEDCVQALIQSLQTLQSAQKQQEVH